MAEFEGFLRGRFYVFPNLTGNSVLANWRQTVLSITMLPQDLPESDTRLLVTMTGEPIQPVRLYYRIPSRVYVVMRLRSLGSVNKVPQSGEWEWLYHSETRDLQFGPRSYAEVLEEVQPIVLGRIRFPKKAGMRIDVRSVSRAIEAARFFGPILGPKVVARRARILNRLSRATLGPPEAIDRELDRNVTVIDPAKTERKLKQILRGVRTMEDAERRLAASLNKLRNSGEDVPSVEDFPLVPEEETPDFGHLTGTLNLRFIRAWEHYKGNTHLTLTEIIVRSVEQDHSSSKCTDVAPRS